MFGVCAGTVISSSEGSLHDLSDLWHRSDVKPRFWKPKKIPSSLTIFGAVFDHRVCILEPHKAWNLKGIIKTPHCSRPELPEKNFQVFEVHLERKGQMPQWRSATSWESIGEWWFPISNFKCPISNSYTIPIFDPLESLVSKFRLQNETFCRPTLSIERVSICPRSWGASSQPKACGADFCTTGAEMWSLSKICFFRKKIFSWELSIAPQIANFEYVIVP